ncbi:membrane-associated lipoprotein involved in thiamine biosynthesis [Cryptosporangium arvum DSM 44712]|uniref:FAD:protein FMN transferase n=2 Tax=Cryptosporangium TaxID=65502 RepID=A0A010ZMD0_9ACTN|nr:FAD:protein FMN transferase [Cryptosporangium arvum]EXG79804.1 membrane-associated lipoprotein involved in thiamine biosynthesis [Cryptosporangium arvum DSM 44712]
MSLTATAYASPSLTAALRATPVRRVEECMGTVFSLDARGVGVDPDAVDAAIRWLHWVDRTFSTYQPDSVVSRLSRGELTVDECPAEVREVLGLVRVASIASDGYFSEAPHGFLDPTGIVKGWAVERASDMLVAAGSTSHVVNGGGDVQLVGEAGAGRPWRVGVAHPLRPRRLVAVVSASDVAVATSGTAERGRHIVDPHRGAPADELASFTVVGPRLAWVDACATAAFAMGPERGLAWIEGLPGLEALAVLPNGRTRHTTGFTAWGALTD